MTVWDLLGLVRRFWYVTFVGLLATGAGVGYALTVPGVIHGQVNLVFLAPPTTKGNVLINGNASLISAAGVVATIVGGPGGTARPVSSAATLVGEGATTGYRVEQPNSGGQWEYRFVSPVLDVQTAGRDLAQAQGSMATGLESVRTAVDKIQDDAGVSAPNRIRLSLSPAAPVYAYAGPSRRRAVVGSVLAGALLTLGALVLTAEFADRRAGAAGARTPQLSPTGARGS